MPTALASSTQRLGWAQYDRHFAVWAEREGYRFDTITQTDLHLRPEILADYACVVIVGHDEYWTREMRLAIEAFVEQGGHLARFGANFTWQIRLEEAGHRQVCYKSRAQSEDPVRGTTGGPSALHRLGRPGCPLAGRFHRRR